MKFIRYIGPVLSLLLAASCVTLTGRWDSDHDMSYLYKPAENALHPRYLVYHESPGRSLLLSRINTAELYFSAANEQVEERAVLKIRYRLFEMDEERNMVDTQSSLYVIPKAEAGKSFQTSILIPAQYGKKYMLEVIATDTLKDHAIQSFLLVDKTSVLGTQNFFPTEANTSEAVFNTHVDSTSRIRLFYNQAGTDSLYVRFFNNFYVESRPPNVMIPAEPIRYLPDTAWSVVYSDTLTLAFPYEGLYHIQADTNGLEGITFCNFGVGWPQIHYADQMLGPIAYVALPSEYQGMLRKPNIKLTVDDYWLKNTRNIEAARELIRVYYNRVFFANYYFSSYKEGWKTERGMIYTVYGPPHIMHKTDEYEEWIYGNPKRASGIRFRFLRVESPYSYNHYLLERSEALITRWSQAVESWRGGRVFNID